MYSQRPFGRLMHFVTQLAMLNLACGAGDRIKPGVGAERNPRLELTKSHEPAKAGSRVDWFYIVRVMTRQSAIARVAGFGDILLIRTWGLRPRLYAGACSAG